MLSDDVFRSKLQATIESLRYWAPSVADAAKIEESGTADYWKFTVSPKVAGACPFELLLSSNQLYDFMIAGELYEDRPVVSLDLFLPLVEGITQGRVVQRRWVSLQTGAVRQIETIVSLANGREWRDSRAIDGLEKAIDAEATEKEDRHFLAYQR